LTNTNSSSNRKRRSWLKCRQFSTHRAGFWTSSKPNVLTSFITTLKTLLAEAEGKDEKEVESELVAKSKEIGELKRELEKKQKEIDQLQLTMRDMVGKKQIDEYAFCFLSCWLNGCKV